MSTSVLGANWNAQTHDVHPGDFDGDGQKDDLLVIAKDPAAFSGIFTSSGGQPANQLQSWHSGFLGINWHSSNYTAIVGDWDANGRDDVLLQSRVPGKSYVLRANNDGRLYAIHQVINDNYLSLGGWSLHGHRIVAGDFNADGQDDLLLQATQSSGTNAIVAANIVGNFAGTLQTWGDNHLGFRWSTRGARIHVGDFNGDQRDDLLVQAQPDITLIDFDVPIPIPVFKPQTFGLTLANASGQFTSIHQLWSRKEFGVDWSAKDYDIVIGDFNGDGRDDVVLIAKRSGKPSYVMLADNNGQISGAAAQTLTPGAHGTNWTAADYRMIALDFNGDGRAELYRQAVAVDGTNSVVSMTSGGTVSAVTTHNAPPISNTLQNAVGRLPGEFHVGADGAATYTIGIDVPAGTNGLKPSLSLAYSSLAGSGALGVGWDLAGLSEISRCASTLDQDGVTRGVQLNSSDRFCLDGNKLRTTSGAYGGHATQYRTELETFARITSYSSGGSGYTPSTGPQFFKVEGKDGLYYYYGQSEESRIEVQGTSVPRTWALNRVEDRNGNYLTVTYSKATGTHRPVTIEWARTPSGGGPYFRLSFVYENRPAADTDSMYFAGGAITEDKRLKRLEVRAFDNGQWSLVRQYEVTYEPALSSTAQSRVESVTLCSATECLPATRFTYQDGARGWESSNTVQLINLPAAALALARTIDFDGDGRTDLVHPQDGTWRYWKAIPVTSYQNAVNTFMQVVTPEHALTIDVDGDGRRELIYKGPHYPSLMIMSWDSVNGGMVQGQTNINRTPNGKEWVADFDGDGLEDFLYLTESGGTRTFNVQKSLGNGQFSGPTVFYTHTGGVMPGLAASVSPEQQHLVDFNGDGKADLLFQVIYTETCGGEGGSFECSTKSWYALQSDGNSFTQIGQGACVTMSGIGCTGGLTGVGDFNGDGLTDLITSVTMEDFVGYTQQLWYGSGLGLVAGPTFIQNGNDGAALTIDDDGDGRSDLLLNGAGAMWHVMRSTGTGFEAPLSTGVSYNYSYPNLHIFDLDGDGQLDVGFQQGTPGTTWTVRRHNGLPPDLLTRVTDGFGNFAVPQYASLVDSTVHTRGTGASYPYVDVQLPVHVVKSFSSSTGIASPAAYSVSYKYEGFRAHVRGRGFLGFAKRIITDGRAGHEIRVEETYSQEFPKVGMATKVATYQPGTSTRISEVDNVPGVTVLDTTTNNQRYFTYIASTTEVKYEVSAGYSGAPISRITTENTYDGFGNLTDQNTVVTDLQSDSEALNSTHTIQTHHVYDFAAYPQMETNWCIGASTRAEVRSQTPGLPMSSPRVKTFEFDYPKCRVKKEILEPDNVEGDTKVTTEWEYYTTGTHIGQLWKETVTATVAAPATAPAPRSTTLEYHPAGPYVTTSTNALAHSTGNVWNVALGVVTQQTDVNGIAVTRNYDSFGRMTRELLPDGTQTDYLLYGCTSGCGFASGRYQVVAEQSGGGISMSRAATVFDQFDREVQSTRWLLGGAQTHVVTEYDQLGRVTTRSVPFWTGGATYLNTQSYDLLGRPTRDRRPISESDGNLQTHTVVYKGLRIEEIDPEGKTTVRWNNAIGQVVKVIDAANGTTQYAYDQFGNLTSAKDPANNEIVTTYNIRGHKKTTSDPSAGTLTYKYNSFGELVSQRDANQNPVSLQYDAIGRMTRRDEPEGPTIWTWDTAPNGKGMLYMLTSPDSYQQSYSYDSLSRPSVETTTISGQSYQIDVAYNTQGQVDTLTYPQSYPAGHRAAIRFTYEAGMLRRVQGANADATTYWNALDTNAAGVVTSETLGNGISSSSWFDAVTGALRQRDSGPGFNGSVQSLSYQWDRVGNLKQRRDVRGNLKEDFWYDDLHRLDYSRLNDVQTPNLDLSYNALGNIMTKAEGGSSVSFDYSTAQAGCNYSAHSQPNAVRKVGSNSYCYDATGNMTKRGSDEVTWYSYDLPKKINKGSNYSEFRYAADRSRFRQFTRTVAGGPMPAGDETTLYVGGLFEIVTKPSGVIEYKHHIPGGDGVAAIRTVRTNDSADTRYLHKDHLGSVDTITNESGVVLARLSNDALGKRRDADAWSGAPSASAWSTVADVTHRGFTMHEHLDNVDLVHMNGRVYDAGIGRFLSADPFVQSPLSSQSLNRYSYVWNNPLSATDPSGFFSLRKFLKSHLKFHVNPTLKNAFKAIRNMPFQGDIDRYVMTHKWAYTLGMAVATAFTSWGGGFGGALFASYYSYQATGSMTDAVSTLVTVAVINIFTSVATVGFGGDAGAASAGAGGWNNGIAGPMYIGVNAAEAAAVSVESSYWAGVLRWFNIGTTTAGIMGRGRGRGGGASTERQRRATFETAKSWLRGQGMISSNPRYYDHWKISPSDGKYLSCGGEDPKCGYGRSASYVWGTTDIEDGDTKVFRAGVTRLRAQTVVSDRHANLDAFALNTADMTVLETAIMTIAHENWHYMNRYPKDQLNKELHAEAAAWRALQAFRVWRRGY